MLLSNTHQMALDIVSRIKWNFQTDGAPHCCPHCGGEDFFQKITFSTRAFYSQADETKCVINHKNRQDVMSIYCDSCKRKLGAIEEKQEIAA